MSETDTPERTPETIDTALGPVEIDDLARFAEIESLELERIGVPTLIVGGDADSDVPPAHSDYAATTIPGAEHIVLSRGTHLALWVHAEAEAAQARAAALLRAS